MEEIETIKMFLREEGDGGINAISFVSRPATDEHFVHLAEESIKLATVDGDKRIVIGLALVADKPILRKKFGFIYNITFSKETVRRASEKYLKSLKLHNTTVEHTDLVNDIFLTETWIVEDPLKDKTAIYNLNAKEGDWAVAFKVNNDIVWDRIKSGEYTGFSIEGVFKGTDSDLRQNLEALNSLVDEYEQIK